MFSQMKYKAAKLAQAMASAAGIEVNNDRMATSLRLSRKSMQLF
jgi:hypothetical protein